MAASGEAYTITMDSTVNVIQEILKFNVSGVCTTSQVNDVRVLRSVHCLHRHSKIMSYLRNKDTCITATEPVSRVS